MVVRRFRELKRHLESKILIWVERTLATTHPVCASLDDPLSGFAAKRVKSAKTTTSLQAQRGNP
jgi:hypothetical protein